jgi:hypothetical protein
MLRRFHLHGKGVDDFAQRKALRHRAAAPRSAFVAVGSEVTVYSGVKVSHGLEGCSP